MEKTLSPQVRCLVMRRGDRKFGGAKVSARCVGVEHVSEVAWGLVVKGFMGEEEDFELDALSDREPVEPLEDWGDVIMGAGMGKKAGG